jgi:hypothetical protein
MRQNSAVNATGAHILAYPHPCGHIVYPYTDEGLVGQAVCLFATAGLRDGEGVILIISREHREVIRLRLATEGFNADSYEQSGQLTCIAAETLLSSFLANGVIDGALFTEAVERLIEKARGTGHRKVRIIWRDGGPVTPFGSGGHHSPGRTLE